MADKELLFLKKLHRGCSHEEEKEEQLRLQFSAPEQPKAWMGGCSLPPVCQMVHSAVQVQSQVDYAIV